MFISQNNYFMIQKIIFLSIYTDSDTKEIIFHHQDFFKIYVKSSLRSDSSIRKHRAPFLLDKNIFFFILKLLYLLLINFFIMNIVIICLTVLGLISLGWNWYKAKNAPKSEKISRAISAVLMLIVLIIAVTM